ncbi:MAG TPA: sigma factor-like helix-turn-helix DNA-binding protein [Candidatus Gastranaerophilales bacterium]|nr:sigma factor-like helix-turn-helix DNA-binding protein [Candidatus Gastranaerophilales bacterium]
MSEDKNITKYKSREYLINAIDSMNLSKRDTHILKLRYGLLKENKTKILEEISSICNLSKERIRQIITKEIIKIRAYGHINIKKGELDHPFSILVLHLQSVKESLTPEKENNIKKIEEEFGFYHDLYIDLIKTLVH